MTTLCLILFVAAAALWFLSNEYPALFGVYVPACALRRRWFRLIVTLFLLAAVWLRGTALDTGFPYTDIVDCRSVLVVVVSSLLVLTFLRFLSLGGAFCYAAIGAFEAYRLSSCDMAAPMWQMPLAWTAALVLVFCLAALMRFIFRLALSHSHIHLITLSWYMRIATLCCIALTAFSIGINWGGFLLAGASLAGGGSAAVLPVLVLLALSMGLMSPFMRDGSDESAGAYSDFTIYTVLSVGLSVTLTLLFFSFEGTSGLIGLLPAPLSVSSLVVAAIAGDSLAQKRQLVDGEVYMKEAVSVVSAPLGAFLVAYVIFHVTGNGDEGNLVDFTVMAFVLIVLAALMFAGYVRGQRRQREATERIVASQQQQIYEHTRALNDMELKVILSENQALHNAVEMKRQEVMNVALSIVEQKEYLESLNAIVKKLAKEPDERKRDSLIEELGRSLKQRLSYDREVDSQYFYAQAESLHEDFNAKLSENFPDLTPQERRLATLLRLGFSSKYIATLMNITPKSVEISRYRLRQKLGLAKGDNLVNYIKSI